MKVFVKVPDSCDSVHGISFKIPLTRPGGPYSLPASSATMSMTVLERRRSGLSFCPRTMPSSC